MKFPEEILIGPDSMLLIYRPLETDVGTLMQAIGYSERECFTLDAKMVQDRIAAERTIRELRERDGLFPPIV